MGSANAGWIRHVPNILTVLRLLLAVAFPFVPAAWRLAVALTAGISDFVDGWIARRYHVTSHIGALLDGIADKAFVVSFLVTLALSSDIAWWQVVLCMARDIIVALITLVVLLHREWAAFKKMNVRLPGKLTTFSLFGWFVTLLMPAFDDLVTPLFVLSATTSVWAGADYSLQFLHRLRERRKEGKPPMGSN